MERRPQKSSSFSTSSSTTREEKSREYDRHLSLGSISIRITGADDDPLSPTATAVDNRKPPFTTGDQTTPGSDPSAADNESPSQSDLPSLSENIDQFINILRQSPEIAPDLPDVAIERLISLIEKDIAKYYDSSPDDQHLISFLESVSLASNLSAALIPFSSLSSDYLRSLNQTGASVHNAMSFLEFHFHSLLLSTSSPQLPSLLRSIAASMISAGYEIECSQVFLVTRYNAMEADLADQSFEKLSIDEVQRMAWESLETEIVSWTKAFRHAVAVSFPIERELCGEVFGEHRDIAGGIFRRLTRGILIQLLNFAEAVAMTKRSAEKLFKVLHMYEALRDMVPKLDDLFPPVETSGDVAAEYSGDDLKSFKNMDSHEELKAEMAAVQARLGEAAVAMFCDLESSIKSDTGKTPVPGGAVHPLTRYVVNYLSYACEFKNTLEQVFRDYQKLDRSGDDEGGSGGGAGYSGRREGSGGERGSGGGRNSNPFARQMVEAMDLLYSNVEEKAKLYKDLALRNIFMMNNGRYIVQKIKGSTEISQLLGDTWCRKKSSDLRQYHKNYQRETWSKVLGCFKDEGLQVKGSVLKPVLKERFKSFNAMLEEIHKTQSAWIVSDEQLQSELRVSISAVIVPAYRSFFARFSQYLDPGRQTEKYVKFGPEDLETYIDDLFDGNPMFIIRRK
ncbi:hypothetical protein KSP39_PZI005557 [Platanthera zijinensis]|uniref:Exocyst subunit Exo70 family protein n=1 Tax=Platanthera zijinensis TaxID=2320716 RepID=A0AAP0BSV7_9ASPA